MLILKFRGILDPEQLTSGASYHRIKLCKDYFNLVILRLTNNNSNYIKTSGRCKYLSDNLVTFSGCQFGIRA